MQTQFLLGPAGSGKTYRCLAEIRDELLASPDGDPLILLAPKQATFQLERQLLANPSLQGYTRLRILSFERLAQFVLESLGIAAPDSLSEEGRVMVLRALLIQRQSELRVFRASARLTGFAGEFSLLMREFQRHHLPPTHLDEMTARPALPPQLRDKLHDFALLMRAYGDWLVQHRLQDANHLLDVATQSLRTPHSALRVSALWLDGFAEMTPQELDLLAALVPHCERATLAFCLDPEQAGETSWLSPWSVVGHTFSKCRARLESLDGVKVVVEELKRDPGKSRFADCELLRRLESTWGQPFAQQASRNMRHASGIQLFSCANPEQEAVLAAREILGFVRVGGRFRDCAVIVRSLEPCHATLARVFRRYGIPFFLDRRESVSHHPLAELTRFAVRTVAFGWRHGDWFSALKSGLVPTHEDDLDWLENAALQFGWEGNVWRQPITMPANASLGERAERLRNELIPPFASLAQRAAGPLTGRLLAAAVRELWSDLDVPETLELWSAAVADSRLPAIHQTVWEQAESWLENLERAFSTESVSLRDWLPILEAGLASWTVGVIPPAIDQVLIGAIDRSRNPDLKFALVLGFNEGVFPAPPTPGTLLTDADRAALERQDIILGPTVQQRLGHERYFGYIACTRASERLVLTRATHDSEGQPLNPSPLLQQVKQITGVGEESFHGTENWQDSEHICELAAPVLRNISRAKENGPLPQLAEWPALAPLVQKWRELTETIAVNRLSAPVLAMLYGKELHTSVSALEEFAACPFKFFAARGLRVEERKEFQFDERDKGSFQHEVLREFHHCVRATGRRWRDLSVVEARVIVANIACELLAQFEHGKFQADGAARFVGELLIERLGDLVEALIEWMPQYDFDPVLAEIGFGLEVEGLPAWRLELPDGRTVRLRGRIDRVDLHRTDDDSALAVVIDYKSTARKLNTTKLHHGLELQLLSYLGVLRHLADPKNFFSAKKLLPVGVFYVPLNGIATRPSSTRSEALAEDTVGRREAYQHSGRLLAEVLIHFDNRGESKGDQFKYARNQNGSLAVRGNEAVPSDEFERLREKTEGHVRDYARRIFAGEVDVSPFRIGQETACGRCDFRAVCRFDPWTQPFRVLRLPTTAKASPHRKGSTSGGKK